MANLEDYTNSISDPKERRAIHDSLYNIGSLMKDDSLLQSKIDRDYVLEEFETEPISAIKGTGAIPAETTGTECVMNFGENILESHVLGTQTLLIPRMAAGGLNIAGDQTNTDGWEICGGILANCKQAFVVGTSPPFFFEAEINIGTVAGTDDCAVGFRKAEAYQANIDDYDEMAALNCIAADITIETILNNGGTASQDTGDDVADGVAVKLKVMVDSAGLVTFTINGAPPTTTATFTFDATEVVVPFIYALNNATLLGTLYVTSWECGIQ